MATPADVREAYSESLGMLTFNSRPVIMNLTELANEYRRGHAALIVQLIEERLKTVKPDMKLPCLYLMDSIMKNHGDPYRELFAHNVVFSFSHVFQASEVKTRAALYKLRTTWGEVFPQEILNQLDLKVQTIDPKWPAPGLTKKIHINPAVFNKGRSAAADSVESQEARLQREMNQRKLELMELEKKRLELQLQKAKEALNKDLSSVEAPTSTTSTSSVPSGHSSKNENSLSQNNAKKRDPRMRKEKEVKKPTSTSSTSARSKSASTNPVKKGETPPPPPTIRGDYVGSNSPIRSASDVKASSSSRLSPHRGKSPGRGSKSPSSSTTASSSTSKRRRTDSADGSKAASSSSSSPSSAATKKSKTESNSSGSSKKKGTPPLSRRERSSSSSSRSPSPPPLLSSLASEKEKKRSYRIPKKKQQQTGAQMKKRRTPSPSNSSSFVEEGPHVEFNKGKPMQQQSKSDSDSSRQKRRNESSNNRRQQPADKKSKLSLEIFGDEDSNDASSKSSTLVSPSVGWADVKKTKPDEFRTPLRQQERGHDREQRRRGGGFNRGQRGARGGGGPFRRQGFPHPAPFGDGGGPSAIDLGQQMRNLGDNVDPRTVQTVIIPQIISEAQNLMANGAVSQDQFSALMKQVMVLKEQALMNQAERNHHQMENKENQRQGGDGIWAQRPPGPAGPSGQPPLAGMPPMPPRPGMPDGFGLRPGAMQGPFGLMRPPMGPPMRPPMGPPMGPPPPGPVPDLRRDLPAANLEDLELLQHDPAKTISIDIEGHPQHCDIRFYGETGVCVMTEDEVRELSFKPGKDEGAVAYRRVFIDGDESLIPRLDVSATEYTDFCLDGVTHKIKIGAPTREVWIDGQGYECFFGSEKRIRIGQSFHTLQLEGPAPEVHIGDRRPDLCAGFVRLIHNGDIRNWHKLFLDAKPQLLELDGKPHVLRFVEGLHTLTINGHPFRATFGSIPMVIYVNGNKHYLRLSSLPPKLKLNEALVPRDLDMDNATEAMAPDVANEEPSEDRFDSEGQSSAFDRLLMLFPKQSRQDSDAVSESEYSISGGPTVSKTPPAKSEPASTTPSPSVDVHNLWSQLLGAGLVKTEAKEDNSNNAKPDAIPGLEAQQQQKQVQQQTSPVSNSEVKPQTESSTSPVTPQQEKKEEAKEEKKPAGPDFNVKPIILKSHHASLKKRQQSVINHLFDPSALQCKNCGLRYRSTEMALYTQHLDWHFRMKRREKDNAKRAQSRKWYFELNNWIISEEIEDAEKNALADSANAGDAERGNTPDGMPSAPVSENEAVRAAESTCPVCNEKFEEFFKEEEDGDGFWCYRNSVRPDEELAGGRVYHPGCYQDFKSHGGFSASAEVSMDDSRLEESSITEGDADGEVSKDETAATNIKQEAAESPLKDSPVKTENGEVAPAEAMDTTEPEQHEQQPAEEEAEQQQQKEELNGDETPAVAIKTEVVEEETTQTSENEQVVKDEEIKKEPEEAEEDDKEEKEKQDESLTLDDVSSATTAMSVAPAKASIKINITSQVDKLERRESVMSSQSEGEGGAASTVQTKTEDSEYDVDAIVQKANPELADRKPKIKNRQFMELPMQTKDNGTSSMCSIM